MNSLELVDSFSEFKELKSIDKQTMQHVLEDEGFLFLRYLRMR
jgi:N utilization substance protein A